MVTGVIWVFDDFSSSAFTAFEVDDLQRGESRPWVGSSLLALNGGGRFLSPSSPLSSLLCSLVSWETLSALLSKLKYYGLTGLLMQLTLSKLGFRGNWLPRRNVRSRVYDGAWERWRIVCLVALSVEDIDIYLFGTMITGILLIGLGFALGLSKNSENGNSCPKPHKAARMIEAVGRAVSIETKL